MTIRIASYNIEWFEKCFNKDNSVKTAATAVEQMTAIKQVLELINADLITIIEAPNTTATTGDQNTITKLENFAQWAGLATTKAMTGYLSSGRQEIAILYNPDKMTVSHSPGGNPDSRSNPPFNGEFFHDTDDDNVKEVYKHYRPPLEARIQLTNGSEFYVLGVHTKSKLVASSVDQLHLEQESRRNRLKLFAECAWIRRRVDDWLNENKMFVVLGDVNDGPGMDLYETRYGKSAVETIMGDIFEPDRILRNYVGRPRWTSTGWNPASARFRDRITETYVYVLIDHILASQNLPVVPTNPGRVWNPYQVTEIESHKALFKTASDHFPVTLDLNFN